MKTIILGVSGSIACYRAADLARDLMREGFRVRVCLTDAAEKFVTSALFEALTTEPCLQGVFEEPVPGRMAHIDWAREADLLLVAPATANVINQVASGHAGDMLTTIALAYEGPMVIAPAMNPTMWQQETVQESIRELVGRGAEVVMPGEGVVACGEEGQGKLATNAEIIRAVVGRMALSHSLAGKKVLITSGPTQERIDDVRYIGNRSSGKMGAALAQAFLERGAEVSLVSGPTAVAYPKKAQIVRVESATQMLEAAIREAESADWVIGAAAVADYRVEQPVNGKMRRKDEPLSVTLVPNPDILASLSNAYPEKILVGFAAEPDLDLEIARTKLTRKGLNAIFHNNVGDPRITFGSELNQVTMITKDGSPLCSDLATKKSVARWIVQQLVDRFN